MVTIHRAHGMCFTIHTNDHEPPHVHVYGDGQLKATIRGENGLPVVVVAIEMKTSDRRRAMDVILELQDCFLAEWIRINGDRR